MQVTVSLPADIASLIDGLSQVKCPQHLLDRKHEAS